MCWLTASSVGAAPAEKAQGAGGPRCPLTRWLSKGPSSKRPRRRQGQQTGARLGAGRGHRTWTCGSGEWNASAARRPGSDGAPTMPLGPAAPIRPAPWGPAALPGHRSDQGTCPQWPPLAATSPFTETTTTRPAGGRQPWSWLRSFGGQTHPVTSAHTCSRALEPQEAGSSPGRGRFGARLSARPGETAGEPGRAVPASGQRGLTLCCRTGCGPDPGVQGGSCQSPHIRTDQG